MAIAAPRPHIEAPTQETGTLPRIPERERRRASSITMPRIAPGRYLAIEDGDDVVLLRARRDLMHIGRSPAADIVLDDASVSRRHALVTRRGETTVILDDRSLNGVQVNGVRVTEKPSSHDGDTVLIGHVVAALRRTRLRSFDPPDRAVFGLAGPDRLVLSRSSCRRARITPGSSSSRCCWRGWRSRSRRRSSPPPCRRSSASTAPTRRRAAWILTGYLLAASVATPIVGKLGDLFGRGRVLTIVLLVFAAGSAVCALAPSLGVLVARARHPGRRRRDLPARVRDHPRDVPARAGGDRDRRDQRDVRHRRRRRARDRGPDRRGARRVVAVLARPDGAAGRVRDLALRPARGARARTRRSTGSAPRCSRVALASLLYGL